MGRRVPRAEGRTLAGRDVALPDDLGGRETVLLVAYRRATQADIDRWRDFLAREAPDLRVVELPVIPSVVWRPFGGWIDAGMRGGVPRSLWEDVVTVYATGERLRDFFGDDGTTNAVVAVLDRDGLVVWCAAAGFTPAAAHDLLVAIAAPTGDEAGGDPVRDPTGGAS